jgi:type VI secretion system protein ImpF
MPSEQQLVLTQSLLDRLIDESPGTADPPLTYSQSLRLFKAGLKRDLEWLLNTRQSAEPYSEELPEVAASLLNYGLLDLASVAVDSAEDRARLARMLESTIARFEHRLADVRVTVEPPTLLSRRVRFHIEALLRVDPAPEQIDFDTVLELSSGQYEVR